MKRFLNAALAGLILTTALSMTPVLSFAQDHRYHDKKHKDDHDWNDHENEAYKIWMKNNHRKNVEFERLRPSDQQSYWNWRHTHSDALLKINIR